MESKAVAAAFVPMGATSPPTSPPADRTGRVRRPAVGESTAGTAPPLGRTACSSTPVGTPRSGRPVPLGPRRIDDAECFRDPGGIGDITVTSALVEWLRTVALMREQEAVDLRDVHPLQQVGVGRVIGPTVQGDATHALVDAAHPVDRTLGVAGGAERRHGEERAGALQSAPGITPIVGVLGDARHRQRMQGLQKQRAQTADEHRRVGVHPTNGRSSLNQRGPGVS